ncbi:non-hydrolyzing UDP-N-acetylglucosamine 2-epimerase [Sphingomonas quercus]|uniref:non-hydrolyzing UDP-N-acetylglucosamine 2-epimerase n=1 Tax=Sphingomonas quercus TaxID=2842451 RepID=UPI0034342710
MSSEPGIAVIIGTRPEAIKMAPVIIAARDAGLPTSLVTTGQHGEMCDDALAAFGLSAAHRLAIPRRADGLEAREAAIEAAVGSWLAIARPGLVLVQGDTSSAYAAALAARSLGIPLGHVEAGLRSYDMDRPFPEERYRVAIDRIAALLFAPTPEAAANLGADRAVRGQVLITGNTVIDALLTMRARLPPAPPDPRRLVLVTCHRREAIGDGIDGICAAVARLAARDDVRILLPLHPNPAIRAPVQAALRDVPQVTLSDPLPYPEWVAAMSAAHLILSDSGGMQEEAPALGVPLLVLREVTERPEGLASGSLRLVGTNADRIVAAATRLLDDPRAYAAMAVPRFPFGRGRAARHIIKACLHYLRARSR